MKRQQRVQGVEIGLRLAFALAHAPGPIKASGASAD